jgi:hypothetical protein
LDKELKLKGFFANCDLGEISVKQNFVQWQEKKTYSMRQLFVIPLFLA